MTKLDLLQAYAEKLTAPGLSESDIIQLLEDFYKEREKTTELELTDAGELFPVYLNNKGYYGIKEFDTNFISMYLTIHKESTSSFGFAISSREYRRGNPVRAAIDVANLINTTVFKITDDWGMVNIVTIPNTYTEEIQKFKQRAIEEELWDPTIALDIHDLFTKN